MVSKTKSKSKIIELSLDNTSLSFEDNEPETESQEMNKVIDEIKTEPETQPRTNETELQTIQEEPKAKAKQTLEVVEEIVEEPPPVIKELTPCPRCGKMTENGIRYSHKCMLLFLF